jgi:hypothetical protein
MEIVSPKRLERVGLRFRLKAIIPTSILKSPDGKFDPVIYCDFLTATGKSFRGVGQTILISQEQIIGKEAHLDVEVDLNYYLRHIEATWGYVVIKLHGRSSRHEKFQPVIIDGFELPEEIDSVAKERHRHIEKTIWKYRNDWRVYTNELARIRNSLVEDASILEGVLKILNQSEEPLEALVETDEDQEVKALREKYREAIIWVEFLGAGVGRNDGFEFRVYSNDHDSHFHVVHKGRGIDARFSFPELQLVSYKGKEGKMRPREQKRVQKFFSEPNNFQKLKDEFDKRNP